jgi:hypothetical protein
MRRKIDAQLASWRARIPHLWSGFFASGLPCAGLRSTRWIVATLIHPT